MYYTHAPPLARKQCILCSALRHESYLTIPYVTYRLEIHSALELSRTVLLCYCLRRETARWQSHPGFQGVRGDT